MTVEVPFSIIITLAAINSSAVIAFVGVVVYLALRLGRLPTRQEHNELRTEMKGDTAELRAEVKGEIAEFRREHREDIARLSQELREEFRRSHQQIMLALVDHSHREDGQAVFTLPPEMETTPAPADN